MSRWPKFGQKGQNRVITFGWKQAKMLDFMARMYATTSICLGKLSFGEILGKTARKLSINQIASFSKCYNF